VLIGGYGTRESPGHAVGTVRGVNGFTNLEELFERYESLPSQDAEDEKREVVDRILSVVAQNLASFDPGDDRYRGVRDAAARVRLLAPRAVGFDDAVLDLIDEARAALGRERLADAVAVRPPPGGEGAEPAGEKVTEASEESFPASDPPGYAAGADGAR
jgi:hypothetical protein